MNYFKQINSNLQINSSFMHSATWLRLISPEMTKHHQFKSTSKYADDTNMQMIAVSISLHKSMQMHQSFKAELTTACHMEVSPW